MKTKKLWTFLLLLCLLVSCAEESDDEDDTTSATSVTGALPTLTLSCSSGGCSNAINGNNALATIVIGEEVVAYNVQAVTCASNICTATTDANWTDITGGAQVTQITGATASVNFYVDVDGDFAAFPANILQAFESGVDALCTGTYTVTETAGTATVDVCLTTP